LSELHASHTALYTRSDIHYWGLNSLFSSSPADYRLYFAGIWPERRGEQWYVRYVLEDSPAARAGIAQGDQLLQLNDAAFSPFAFTEHADSLVIRSTDNVRRTLSVQSEYQNIMEAFIAASKASRRIFTVSGKRVGYFHLWAARDSILQAMEGALAEFEASRVDALIVDFRGGYGGTSPDYLASLRASTHLLSVPRFFLIDEGVRSGKEMLAAMVKKEKLGILVGSKTAGAFLGAVPVRFFADRYFLLVAAYGSVPVDLPPIEGVGVRPDVEVPLCRARCGGRDAQLEKVLELISRARDVVR
jgi:carboxyl-terminal processing protease